MSAAVASRGALAELLDAWLIDRRFVVVSSDRILEEVERALDRSYFAERLGRSERLEYVALLRREIALIEPRTEVLGIAGDPDDDHVLAAAVDGEARYLVTGDRALLRLGVFRGIDVVTARDLVEALNAEPPPSP